MGERQGKRNERCKSLARVKCNRDCFNCAYKDCYATDMTFVEYLETESREADAKEYSDKPKAKWNRKHPEVIKKAKQKYRSKAEVKEAERQKSLEYYHANRDRYLERNHTDYMKDYKREYQRKYREKLKENKNE